MQTIRELREERAKLVEQMHALVDLSEKEGRDGVLSSEEDEKFNKLHAAQEQLSRQIERRELTEKAEKDLEKSTTTGAPPALDNRATPSKANTEERKAREARAFENWVRYGFDAMNEEQRAIMKHKRFYMSASELPEEIRAQGVGTGAGGGYVVPEGFSGEFDRALKAFGGIRTVARMFPTPDGRDIPWPTVDDTSNVGELLGENTEAAAQDVAFGQVVLKAFKYSSKIVLVSMELLQDSFFEIGTILNDLLAERIGRITNTHFTLGTGSGQPQGVVTAAGEGKVGTTGQATSIIAEDVIDLEHSIDPLYRPNCSYMLADSSLKIIKKLKDTNDRWIFSLPNSSSLSSSNQPATINGYPYIINQDIPVMAASAKSVLFGDFRKYIVRDVREFALLRLQERYAEKGQVGFIAFTRHDGRAINASALKYYQNTSS